MFSIPIMYIISIFSMSALRCLDYDAYNIFYNTDFFHFIVARVFLYDLLFCMCVLFQHSNST